MSTTITKPFTLSRQTMSLLKNFSTLNSNILIKPGNLIRTITPSKNGMAEATIAEDFPVEFGIWDLNKFLGVISLFSSPSLTFGEKSVKIFNNTSSTITYFYSEPKLLTVPTKKVNMPKIDFTVTMTETVFGELQKASSVIQLPSLSIQNEDGTIYANICDIADPTSNSYRTVLGTYDGPSKFQLHFKMDNLRMLPGDYTISFSKNIVAEFMNNNLPVKYWFAMETTSTFED